MSEKTERPFGVILAPLLSKVYHLCGFVRKKKGLKTQSDSIRKKLFVPIVEQRHEVALIVAFVRIRKQIDLRSCRGF